VVVYIDLLILENFIVNCFLLEITAKTVRVNVKWILLLISGFIGSLYVIILFYPEVEFLNTLLVKVLVVLIMIFLTFKSKDIGLLVKASIIYILYSMVLAGTCIFMQYSQGVTIINSNYIMDFTYKKLFIAIMVIFIIVNRLIIYVKERKDIDELIYKVDIVLNSKLKSVNGFLDTGNELREPVTNMPVILVNKDSVKSFNVENCEKYYIPYRVFNGQTGRLEAFKPDYINIHVGKNIMKKEVLIAISSEKLSGIGDYQALLSRGIF